MYKAQNRHMLYIFINVSILYQFGHVSGSCPNFYKIGILILYTIKLCSYYTFGMSVVSMLNSITVPAVEHHLYFVLQSYP